MTPERRLDATHEREPVWLTAREAAARLRFPTVKAFYEWRRRHPSALSPYDGAGVQLFARVDVDAVPTKRRGMVAVRKQA